MDSQTEIRFSLATLLWVMLLIMIPSAILMRSPHDERQDPEQARRIQAALEAEIERINREIRDLNAQKPVIQSNRRFHWPSPASLPDE